MDEFLVIILCFLLLGFLMGTAAMMVYSSMQMRAMQGQMIDLQQRMIDRMNASEDRFATSLAGAERSLHSEMPLRDRRSAARQRGEEPSGSEHHSDEQGLGASAGDHASIRIDTCSQSIWIIQRSISM